MKLSTDSVIQRSNSAPSTPIGICQDDKRSKSCCDTLITDAGRKVQVHFTTNAQVVPSYLTPLDSWTYQVKSSENGSKQLEDATNPTGHQTTAQIKQSMSRQPVGIGNGEIGANFPMTPSIHISENLLSEASFNSWYTEDNKSSYPANHVAACPSIERRGSSPAQSSSGHQYPYHRINRLLSIGPEFHIQIKHPSSIELLHWKDRSESERRLIYVILILLLIVFPVLVLVTYNFRSSEGHAINSDVCLTADCVKVAAALIDAMDHSVEPCEDFFHFACGNWNKRHAIPDDRASVSPIDVLADELQTILRELLEERTSVHDNSATIKAKTFYKSCMNLDKIEETGDGPLKRAVKSYQGWPVSGESWIKPGLKVEQMLAEIRLKYNLGILIDTVVGPDDRNSSVDQVTLGLPSKDYYLKPSRKRDLDAYQRYMVDIAILMGADEAFARSEMQKVLDLEIFIANATLREKERIDTGKMYQKMTLEELSELIPQFDWLLYFNTLLPKPISKNEPVVIFCLSYLNRVKNKISETNPIVLHNYMLWRVVQQLVVFLGGPYQAKRAEFRKVTSGITAERLRWSICVDMINKRLGTAVGSMFIRNNFDPESKKTALKMIQGIREAFNELLEENDWMDDETKKMAKEKADAMNEKIGYSEALRNDVEVSKEYEQLNVEEDQFLINVLNLLKYESVKNFEKLGKPVDKDLWATEPAVVNAFYNPNKNDILFPAGILQPHFYGHNFPKSINYGGIGVVIGHEITHGFDSKGRQYDKNGNMVEWWNNATLERFNQRTRCIIDQYSSYVLKDININIDGELTQLENIADNGGLKQAYRAFKKWEQRNRVEPLLPGLKLNHDQLFFLNYAQIWCGSMRPQEAFNKVRNAVHSPGPIRVLGPLSNSYDFARAYECPVGSRMNPKKKCSVW